ncbi:MAG TPA: pilus assembly protein PilP [Gallionellaceae bacterium]
MISRRWLLLPVMLTLSACGTEEFDDLQKFVKESGADMRGNIEKPPEIKPYEPFNYRNPDNLPDPFRPNKPTKPKAVASSDGPAKHDPEDLENYTLESLKMIGYIKIHGVANAVISSPDGKVHHVHAGNYMGQNFGKIISITDNEIRLQEKVLDSTGAWTDRTSTLELQE